MVFANLGGAYHAVDRTDDAATVFQRALEIEPRSSIYNNLATMRFFQGRLADAAAAFEKAIELNPTNSLYWGNLGDTYRWMPGHEAKAREAFTTAIKLAQGPPRQSVRRGSAQPRRRLSRQAWRYSAGARTGAEIER